MPHVKVKVCGLTSVADALMCAEAGADWIGLNFHPASPRCVSLLTAAEIVAAVSCVCTPVGLFVDWPPKEVAKMADRLGLRVIQLHGHEPPEDLRRLARFQVIRAFRLGGRDDVENMTAYLRTAAEQDAMPAAVLVDAFVAGQPGGTGQMIAPDLLDALQGNPRLILAGGLTPENVAERVARVRPWMVDVASGVESSPGRKDAGRVRAFVRAARGTGKIRNSGA